MRKFVVLIGVALARVAVADVKDLPVIEQHIFIPLPKAPTAALAEVNTFRMIAESPLLTAQINAQLGADSEAFGLLEESRVFDAPVYGTDERESLARIGSKACEVGFATSVFVSWMCRGGWHLHPGDVTNAVDGHAYFIESGQLRPATFDAIFKPGAKLPSIEDCQPSRGDLLFVSPAGIEFIASGKTTGCSVPWDDLAPLLLPKSPLPALAARKVEPKPKDPSVGWPKVSDRFVVTGETVRDKLTNLEWATHDNSTDVTWAQATAYATAYRGSGKSDWRLPTEAELEALSESAGPAHKEKTDCTKGKNQLMVTELIHISCGLAWSSDEIEPDRAVAFGFTSGTSRVAKQTEKKNSRALVVRKEPKPKKS
jgi:hypothetical protein